MPTSITKKGQIKAAKNGHSSPEKISIIGKLFKPILVIFKWIAKGSEKEPICRS
ncbi:MAG: hypothetical protein MUD09_00465 [Desulfobacterales bacterium]|jgi:hypothetical protein|nr:hypothetical protein [Desulfobacterales bacterium]